MSINTRVIRFRLDHRHESKSVVVFISRRKSPSFVRSSAHALAADEAIAEEALLQAVFVVGRVRRRRTLFVIGVFRRLGDVSARLSVRRTEIAGDAHAIEIFTELIDHQQLLVGVRLVENDFHRREKKIGRARHVVSVVQMTVEVRVHR